VWRWWHCAPLSKRARSKSDVIQIMDSLSCFVHNVNSTSRIQDAIWKCTFTISV
jgi:hypothetical protein